MEIFKYREAQWSEANEAFDYFMAQLKERLVGDDPVDLRGTKNLDPSFTPFRDRAPVLLKDVSDTRCSRRDTANCD